MTPADIDKQLDEVTRTLDAFQINFKNATSEKERQAIANKMQPLIMRQHELAVKRPPKRIPFKDFILC